ncbi:MBL fold metallo-hydrolase [Alkaliphilus sp. B6464]|uniref:MBL fold metallo-hydrolase n=1 Tax=Alkaliphilus sp. B6464 TaxID=2731219 RepID=UPI001BA4700F|nr:MBL fold metallo-hydrolase [Alkaliphilus sp. B6464]QUH19514.1 MBL fold metallo-hydrolase [Alkaliphilus sp. B6464]
MQNINCNIVHLGHSSFLVETKNNILIFDYFNDIPVLPERSIKNGVLSLEDFKTDKDIFVFVTHSHSDHYNPVIFQWENANPNIKYVLGSDVKEEVEEDRFYYMNPYETLQIKDVNIKTYGSTDKGVSFLVDVDSLDIFHAGDLNWWHWKEFTEQELKREEEDFKREVDNIIGNNIDVAFIPVDPRLEEFYHLAGVYFAEKVKPKFLVPMHFRDNFYVCKDFVEQLKDSSVKVVELTHVGQRIGFSK